MFMHFPLYLTHIKDEISFYKHEEVLLGTEKVSRQNV